MGGRFQSAVNMICTLVDIVSGSSSHCLIVISQVAVRAEKWQHRLRRGLGATVSGMIGNQGAAIGGGAPLSSSNGRRLKLGIGPANPPKRLSTPLGP